MNACGGINDQNSDVRYDRPLLIEYTTDDVCGQIEKVLSSPAMSAPDSSLVALHCIANLVIMEAGAYVEAVNAIKPSLVS